MRTTTLLISLFLVMGNHIVAQTQVPIDEPIEKFRQYVGTGISAPTGLLEQAGHRGYHFWGRVGYALSSTTELMVGPEYHTFDRDNHGLFGARGGRFYTVMLGVGLKYNLGQDRELRNPYIFAGAGWAFMEVLPLTTAIGGTQRFESTEGAFIEGGAGMEMGWVFLQFKVVRVAKRYIGDQLTHLPFSVGLKF